jgi:DNA-binding CsgD family transcriptional regulator
MGRKRISVTRVRRPRNAAGTTRPGANAPADTGPPRPVDAPPRGQTRETPARGINRVGRAQADTPSRGIALGEGRRAVSSPPRGIAAVPRDVRRAADTPGRGLPATRRAAGDRGARGGDGDASSPLLRAPPELSAHTFRVGAEEFVVLSYPMARVLPPPELTSAERHVVVALMEGKSNAAIAEERGTSPRTIANQVAAVFRKLGVRSRAELAARCIRGTRDE